MPSAGLRRMDGSQVGSVELSESVFGIEPNLAVLHQVVTAQLAAARAGTHSTKGRAEVRGGGAKPWRQKGTGRSRQGSVRAPQWEGGGVAHGPKPRSYRQRTPKKMVQLALRSALSDRAAQDRVVVVDSWDFEAPRTKEAKAALASLGVEGKVLVVVDQDDHVAALSFRNLPDVHVIPSGELNAYDVLCNDWVLFTSSSLPPGGPERPAEEVAQEGAVTSAGEGKVVQEGAVTSAGEAEVAQEGAVTSAGEGQVPEEAKSPPPPQPEAPPEGQDR